ncbi:MAG TPA: hypothetical protein VN083_01750, partial [Vicinamibacteria bacterium]|nr:hypothetical protein [Vicinamibacteria bacterium]
IRVLHNTIVVARDRLPQEGMLCGLVIPFNEGNNRGSVYRNNLVTASLPETCLVDGRNMPEAFKILGMALPSRADAFLGLTLDHNLWFHPGRPKPFHWGPSYRATYDYALPEWQALPGSGHGEGDMESDPRLENAAGERPEDFRPADARSPSIGAGADAGVVEDFAHAPRPKGHRPTIGAFEVSPRAPAP